MTRRFDEMITWYQKVFEAKVQYQNPALAFLTYDDEHHRFAFANMAVFSPNGVATNVAPGVGVNHVGYTYATLGDLLETYERLKKLGINRSGRTADAVQEWCVSRNAAGSATRSTLSNSARAWDVLSAAERRT